MVYGPPPARCARRRVPSWRRALWWHPEAMTGPVLPLRADAEGGDLLLVGGPGVPVPDAVRTHATAVHEGLPEARRPDIAWHGTDSLPRVPVPVHDDSSLLV